MRILFVGGKDIGCGCLKELLKMDSAEVVGVIINRGGDFSKDRWYGSVAEIALTYNIPILKPYSINDDVTYEFTHRLQPDLVTVVYYDQLLKKRFINIPSLACINLHMALAEEYRGCYPTTWALVNDERSVGVTIHHIDEGMDTGDIIAQCRISVEDSDIGRTLYSKCTEAGIQLFAKTIEELMAGTAKRVPQETTEKTKVYHRKDFPSFDLELKENYRSLYNHARALMFEPFPCPYFYIGERKILLIDEARLKMYGNEQWS